MQVQRPSYLPMALQYTRALYLVDRREKTENMEDRGLLGTRPTIGTHHFYLYSVGWNQVTWASPDHKKSEK